MDTQQLVTALAAHQWQIVVALVLIALVALAGDVVVRAGVKGRALQVVSLVRGYVGGVAGALLVGGLWWQALIAGLGATGVSAGARDLLVDAVRWLMRRGHAVTTGLLCGLVFGLVLLLPGCACVRAIGALRAVQTEQDVFEALPLVAECAQKAGEVLGQCRAGGLEALPGALLEQATPEAPETSP